MKMIFSVHGSVVFNYALFKDDDVAPTEKSNQVTNEDDDFGINSIVNSPTGAIDLTRKTVDSYGPKTAMDNIDVTVSDDSDSDVGYTIFRKRLPSISRNNKRIFATHTNY